MNPSRLFIQRPIATSLLMLAILLSGIVAYQFLPISSLPEVDYPTIVITTFYPGASPDVMTTTVTAPLERQFGQMPGLNQMSSASSTGSSIITLQFSLDLSLDVAEQEVQNAINLAATYLPNDLPNPPVYSKVNPADAPILTIALSSDTLPLPQVEDFADTRLAQKIAQVSGVGLVSLSGGQRPAVRIQANPTALLSYGLAMEDLRAAIVAANVNAAKGSFDGPRLSYTINSNDQLLTSADYNDLVVAYKNNAPIRLNTVAQAIDDAENVNLAAWMNLKPAVIMNIQRQPGANVISVVDSIKKRLPQLRALLPSSIQTKILTDRTLTIRASIADVQEELLIAVLLVVLIIYLFLGKVRATLIPSVAVPLSLIGALGAMYLCGFSLNNLTLMALTIATGFVVDDAIVMIENISRYIDSGEKPLAAALKGSAQIGFTIMSLTVSLIAVMIPLLFMGDIIGRLFREFAITLSITILISAFVSLTLTPMLCARVLSSREPEKDSRLERKMQDTFKQVLERYSQSLNWVLERQGITLLLAGLTLLLTLFLFYFIPKGFFPVQDSGVIQGISEASQDISFAAMAERQQALAKVVLTDPAVENLSSFIGIDGTNTSLNSGRMLITLKPLEERKVSAAEIIRRLQAPLSQVPGANLYLQSVQDLTIDNRVSRQQYQYSISAVTAQEVAQWTDLLLKKFSASPLLQEVSSNQQNLGLQTKISYDRDTAYRLGISSQLIDDTLYDAFGQRQISIMFTQKNQYRVVLETMPKMRRTPSEALGNLHINSNTGGAVTMDVFLKTEQKLGPLVIYRQGQFPVSNLSFNLAPGVSLGAALDFLGDSEKELQVPDSVTTSLEGAAKTFQNSLSNEGWLLLAAIITVYIVLGVLYESYIHPLTILSTLPSATVGALLALEATGNALTIIALIGIILLIGIVMKNAILMIDFALEQERLHHKNPKEAIYQACQLRFRPIIMTTFAAMLAALPLALGGGMGAELRQPLGIAIIGGLALSQLLTLYTTPVIYLAFDRLARGFVRWRCEWLGWPLPEGE